MSLINWLLHDSNPSLTQWFNNFQYCSTLLLLYTDANKHHHWKRSNQDRGCQSTNGFQCIGLREKRDKMNKHTNWTLFISGAIRIPNINPRQISECACLFFTSPNLSCNLFTASVSVQLETSSSTDFKKAVHCLSSSYGWSIVIWRNNLDVRRILDGDWGCCCWLGDKGDIIGFNACCCCCCWWLGHVDICFWWWWLLLLFLLFLLISIKINFLSFFPLVGVSDWNTKSVHTQKKSEYQRW